MGFWDKLFGKKQPEHSIITYSLEDILSGVTPIYSTDYGQNIYASDVVQQAIYSIVTELKKLDPVHIRKMGTDFTTVEGGKIQGALDAPNPLMTTSDFIEKISWLLFLNYNAFIYPVWEGDTLKYLYPLYPRTVELDDKCAAGGGWVRFHFPNGYQVDLPYDDIIHLRYKYSASEFMGGNEQGQPDFKPLVETLKLNDALLTGLAKSLNLQTTINGVVKLKTMQNKEEQLAKIKEFEQKLRANESGLLPIDVSAEYQPITKQVNLLDEKVLEFIDKKIFRTFGVSIAIVDGDYNKEQYEAFYQKTLEPIVKSWGQAFTKGIFSKRETQGFKNEIAFYVKELIFLNTQQKLELFSRLGERGACYENEFRTAFGLRPIPELAGKRMQSLNYVDSDIAKNYQLNETGGRTENE